MSKTRKYILVGPIASSGGVTRYVQDLAGWSGTYQAVVFNTARPSKNAVKAVSGYRELFNAGPARAFQGAWVTMMHVMSYPWILLFSQSSLVHICGVSYWTFWENAYYIFIARLLGRKVILHYLGALDLFYERRGRIEQAFIRAVLGWPHRLVVLSQKAFSLAEKLVPPNRLAIIPSSVDIRDLDGATEKPSSRDGVVRILFMGGADPFRKGIYDLIRAAALVHQVNSKVRFVLAGGDSIKTALAQSNGLGLNDYIEFVGWVPENHKKETYQSADILVLPSHNEGLPYVVIEAMACALPVIASSVGGIPEVVCHGENGFIIKPGDRELLARYILLLAGDEDLRRRIGSRNRELVFERYSLSSSLAHLFSVFDQVHAESAPASCPQHPSKV